MASNCSRAEQLACRISRVLPAQERSALPPRLIRIPPNRAYIFQIGNAATSGDDFDVRCHLRNHFIECVDVAADALETQLARHNARVGLETRYSVSSGCVEVIYLYPL
jgi:hypothetical protein